MTRQLLIAAIAQTVERVLGKDEVSGSIPDSSSIFSPHRPAWRIALRVFSILMGGKLTTKKGKLLWANLILPTIKTKIKEEKS